MQSRKPKPPLMTPYANRRARKYLYEREVIYMTVVARETGRYGHRDATMIWMMYRHGLRVSEVRALTWKQINFDQCRIYVKRSKNGLSTTQLLAAHELGALILLRPKNAKPTDAVFLSSRGGSMSHATVYKMIARAGRNAEIDFPVNPHALRHACGFHLTNVRKADTRRVQEYLGHKDIRHTVRYTELDDSKFEGLWEDEGKPPVAV